MARGFPARFFLFQTIHTPPMSLSRLSLLGLVVSAGCLASSAAHAVSALPFQSNVSCRGGNNGTATVIPTSGVAPFTYTWDHGPTTSTASGLAAGNYRVTVDDGVTPPAVVDFTISEPPALVVVQTQTHPSPAGNNNGVASVSVTGATPPYSYAWSPAGGTAATASGRDAGSYTVTITDANFCVYQSNFTLVDAPPAPVVNSVDVPADGTYLPGQNLDFTVNFSGAVLVDTTGGTPSIGLTVGATARSATYLSGSGTAALVFRHTVLPGDADADGVALGMLQLNGGTLKDSFNQNPVLTLNSVASTSGVLVVPALPPSGIAVGAANGWTVDAVHSAGFIALSGHAKSPSVPAPAGVSFPHGLYDFALANGSAGSTATVTITYPSALPAGAVYWKFGAEPGNTTPHWYVFPGAVISSDRMSITLTITDGQQGDSDLATAGRIVDPGGPGVQVVTTPVPVPSLSAWAVMLLSALMALFVVARGRQRG